MPGKGTRENDGLETGVWGATAARMHAVRAPAASVCGAAGQSPRGKAIVRLRPWRRRLQRRVCAHEPRAQPQPRESSAAPATDLRAFDDAHDDSGRALGVPPSTVRRALQRGAVACWL